MEDLRTLRPLVVEGILAGEPSALDLPTGTVTFLLTDVESSTRHWEEAPAETAAAVTRHYDLLDEVVARHDGVRPVEQGEGGGGGMAWVAACEYALRGRGRRGRPSHGWDSLTPTELLVVDHVVEGLTNPQIAKRLLVGTSTVTTHVHHIFTKLGLGTRAELVAAALSRSEAASS